MSDYMLAPGARLEVGPHGKLYESVGACCASCASGGPCTGAPLSGITDALTDPGFWLGIALGFGVAKLMGRKR